MGQKVNPHGIRVGVIKNWDTQWYANKKNFGANVKEDYEIRQLIKKQYYAAAITTIAIERAASKITVTVHTARPGVLIGKAGSEIEVIKSKLSKLTHGKQVSVNIVEVKKPDCDAQLIAESIASQLEKRASFRRCKTSHRQSNASWRKRCESNGKRSSRRRGNRKMRAVSRGFHSSADFACRHRIRLLRSPYHVRRNRR